MNMKTMTMPSANGKAPIQIEKILDEYSKDWIYAQK